MRLLSVTLSAAAVLLTGGAAYADSFLEVAGGLSIPVGDSNWTNLADTSAKLGARFGAMNDQGLGAMLQADWTPVNLNYPGGGTAGASIDYAGHEFRFLADFTIHHPILPKLLFGGRAGIGLDIAHASLTTTLGNSTSSISDTDLGLALEFGAGLWYPIGDVQIGGEIALPISTHSKHGTLLPTDGHFTFDYTSYDIDLLFGVRVLSR
ncbi:MAG TPA: hypothetical protein VIV58_02040 [Kofleriaceae bacterium]